MKFSIKNKGLDGIMVYIEPSCDEIFLQADDVLLLMAKFESEAPFEFDVKSDSVVIWIPHGNSADAFINGSEVETMCSKFTW
ncbi:hypothetical protein IGB42_01767 [Andreprevotia sp. IGB-42]|uniref:hypothetical protein n=1 Tax=Andreprevotia sp. IGB-42 TaxID=2497473 RepID=UPI00135C77AB|nr:hypothetical protein [Andreprevotia sp. IGB-42]KAF0813416.1 hypothetical protein IGB42_01767 [Andreprevotia sp. IGB-42]